MKFKIDENLPIEVAELFKQSGYDAMTVLEQDLGGIADADLASICQKETSTLQKPEGFRVKASRAKS